MSAWLGAETNASPPPRTRPSRRHTAASRSRRGLEGPTAACRPGEDRHPTTTSSRRTTRGGARNASRLPILFEAEDGRERTTRTAQLSGLFGRGPSAILSFMRTFTAVIERDPDTGVFVGYVPGWPGAHSQGASLDELRTNLEEVIAMLLEDGEPKLEGEFVGTQTVRVA